MLPDHVHICERCGNETVYHIHDHEEKGDTVEAWCSKCESDTPHTIGRFVA